MSESAVSAVHCVYYLNLFYHPQLCYTRGQTLCLDQRLLISLGVPTAVHMNYDYMDRDYVASSYTSTALLRLVPTWFELQVFENSTLTT